MKESDLAITICSLLRQFPKNSSFLQGYYHHNVFRITKKYDDHYKLMQKYIKVKKKKIAISLLYFDVMNSFDWTSRKRLSTVRTYFQPRPVALRVPRTR